MDPSWATVWPEHEEAKAVAWVAGKLADTELSHLAHLAAVLAEPMCTAAAQPVHLTLALADSRVRLTARTVQPISQTAAAAWQEQAAHLAHRCGTEGVFELWAELDSSLLDTGGPQ